MRTKMEILLARLAEAQRDVQAQEEYITGLINTPCNLRCSGCGKEHKTEADFADHYVIPDEQYLNLGNCPNKNGTF